MRSMRHQILESIVRTGSYTLDLKTATESTLRAIRSLWRDGHIRREPDYTEGLTVTFIQGDN